MKLLALPLGLLLALGPASDLLASDVPIEAADDGTGTTITPVGDRLDISGGTPSRDGANLFHSFSQFDLDANQIANFLSTPALRNILGRVVGGDASFINGLIQVTGGSPNLYLLNPSGVIFGPNARLNVPGDFTVSTATRLGFGDDGFFDVFGNSQYADLVGDPQTFTFVAGESGAILNAGELAVGEGQNLLLLGSTVVNTGRLQTAGGEVILEAVAGTQNVRLSLPGHILSLEVPAEAIASGIQAEALPALLAGGNLPPTGLDVAADGAVTLSATGDAVPTSPGSTVVGGSIDATGPVGGGVQILGDRVGLYEAQVSASGLVGAGGRVLVGGDFQGNGPTPTADLTYVSPNTAIAADSLQAGNGGSIVVWSETATAFAGDISARGGARSGNGGSAEISSRGDLGVEGTFDLSAPSGNAGSVLFDPETITIVSIDADTANDDLELADGAILFEDVSVDPNGGIDADFVITDAAIFAALDESGTVVLQATDSIDFNTDLVAAAPPASGPGASLSLEAADINLNGANLSLIETDIIITANSGSINGGSGTIANIFTSGGADITLAAGGNIIDGVDGPSFLNVTAADGGNIAITAGGNVVNVSASTATEVGSSGNAIVSAGGAVENFSADTSAFDPTGNAGNVEIGAAGDINIPTAIAASSFGSGNGGQVQVESTGGDVVLGSPDSEFAAAVDTSSFTGSAGSIEILAGGSLTAIGAAGSTTIVAESFGGGDGGAVTLTSQNGGISVSGAIGTGSESGNGGNVAIDSATDLSAPLIDTAAAGNAGNVAIAVGGNFTFGSDADAVQIDTASSAGNAGDIAISAGGDITNNAVIDTSSLGGDGGDIALTTTNGSITTSGIVSASAASNAGNVNLEATEDIQVTSSIDATSTGVGNGGQVTVASTGGSVTIGTDADGGSINTIATNGNGGAVALDSAGSLEVTTVNTSGDTGMAGTIALNAVSGIDIGSITATGLEGETGDRIAASTQTGELAIDSVFTNGGDVALENATGSITVDSIGTAVVTPTGDVPSGDTVVAAGGDITVADSVDASNTSNGDGGTVTLTSQNGAIEVGASIATRSVGGNGGAINIDTATTLSATLIDAAAGLSDVSDEGVDVATGNAGDITVSAGGDITSAAFINAASTGGDGGDITLATANGSIVVGSSILSAAANNAGTVDLDATGDIQVFGSIDAASAGAGNGGQVTLTSTGGAIALDSTGPIAVAEIDTSSAEGMAGTVALDADSGIETGSIIATGVGGEAGDRVAAATQTGELTIGAVATTSGSVTLQNETGNLTVDSIGTAGPGDNSGGNVLLEAGGGIAITNGIDTASADNGAGGTVTLASQEGPITVGAAISTGSAGESGSGGAIALESGATLSTGGLETAAGTAGNVSVTAAGDVAVTGAIATISTGTGDGGQVNVASSGGNVTIGTSTDESSINTAAANGAGGAVDLDSAGSLGIATNINTSSSGSAAGDVTIDAAGEITAGGIFAIADSAESGGTVSVTRTNATPGNIALSGPIVTLSVAGDGGAIAVTNTAGDIEIGALSSRSINGTGGEITVDASQGLLRLPGINDAIPGDGEAPDIPESSALSVGGTGNGAIALTHGGNGEIPFIVGDATVNGSAAALIGGDAAASIPAGSFLVDEVAGNVSISTDAGAPLPPPMDPPVIPPVPPVDPPVEPPVVPPAPVPPTPEGDALPAGLADTLEIAITRDILEAGAFIEAGTEDTRSARPEAGGIALSEPSKIVSLPQAKLTLAAIERATGVRPALIYVNFVPLAAANQATVNLNEREALLTRSYERHYGLPEPKTDFALAVPPEPTDRLELLLVTPEGDPTRVVVEAAQRQAVLDLARRFYNLTSNPASRDYLPLAQQLYDVMIRPLMGDLEAAEVDNLVFLLPEGLRLLPVAALHDGDRFLVESFSTGLAPSLSLTDANYRSIQDLKVLAAGATNFGDADALGPLPAVSVEVPAIATQIWTGDFILNEEFTVEGFKAQRRSSPTGIVHLATHADFKLNAPSENYIQFFDRRLRLDEVRQLGLNAPAVELMVLSACRTAFGDRDVELGFGGLAVQAGVKSAMASLWYVGDTGTLALMTEFYAQLDAAAIKADALRAAQIALIDRKVVARAGKIEGSVSSFPLPAEVLSEQEEDLSHPFYWATFTMVGSPW